MIPFVDKDLENLTGIIQVYINRRLRLRQHHFDSTHLSSQDAALHFRTAGGTTVHVRALEDRTLAQNFSCR